MQSSLPLRLRKAARRLGEQSVAVGELAALQGRAAIGSLLILLALPCMLPVAGVGTVLGMGLAGLSLGLWRQQEELRLPDRVSGFNMPARWARRVLEIQATMYDLAGRAARPRLPAAFASAAQRATALTVALMAGLIILPIPFGNVLPAIAISLFGLGMVFRDGVLMLLGGLVSVLAVLFTATLAWGAWQLGQTWLPI